MLIRLSEHMKPVNALAVPHQGTVVDNNDPKKLGRVKCTIPGILEASTDDLPWVNSNLDPSRFSVPEVGDVLKIAFPYNDIYVSEFIGYWHSEANHNAEFDTDYPNTFGTIKQGFKLLYNKISKIGDIIHPSGSFLQIIEDGSVILSIIKDFTWAITGKMTINSTDDLSLSTGGKGSFLATGDLTLSSDGAVNISGSSSVSVTSDGQGTFSGKGGTTLGDSGSTTMVNGTSVLLAGGGPAVALLGSQVIGLGNLGSPVVSTIIEGSSKVLAAK